MYKDLNDYELIYMTREKNIEEDILIRKYAPLINTICKKYSILAKAGGLDYDDLFNEGLNALAYAIRKYDESNSLFYTYANLCITSKIINLVKGNLTYSNKYGLLVDIDDVESSISSYPNKYTNYTEDRFNYDEVNNLLKRYLYDLDYKLMPVFELYINGFNAKEIGNLLDMNKGTVAHYIRQFKNDLKVLLS